MPTISAPAQLGSPVVIHLVSVSMKSVLSVHNVDLEAQRDISHPNDVVRASVPRHWHPSFLFLTWLDVILERDRSKSDI